MSATQIYISDYDLEKLRAYKQQRAEEKHFEMEELFDLLDAIVEDFPEEAPRLGGTLSPEDSKDEPDTCTNHYACLCGEDWSIEATCEHNDRCPKCNKEIEPYYSDSYDDPEPRGKEITAAYNALAHRKETT